MLLVSLMRIASSQNRTSGKKLKLSILLKRSIGRRPIQAQNECSVEAQRKAARDSKPSAKKEQRRFFMVFSAGYCCLESCRAVEMWYLDNTRSIMVGK